MILVAKNDFFWVIAGRVATAIIGLISIRVATTYLTSGQFGALALMMMVQSLCGLFLISPIGRYISRHVHEWWESDALLSRLVIYRYYIFVVAMVGAVVVCFLEDKLNQPSHMLLPVFSMAFMVVSSTWNATFISLLNILGFRAVSVSWAVVSVSISVIVSFGLMQWLPYATVWFFAQAIGFSIGAIGARQFLLKSSGKVRNTFSKKNLIDKKSIVFYSLPLAMAAGLMWFQLSGYRYIVESYWGLTQLGFIAVGFMLAGQVWSVAESLATQFLYPYFLKRISVSEKRDSIAALSDLLNVLGPLYVLFVGVTFLMSPIMIYLLVDEKYSEALFFVEVGVFIECCRALGNVFSNAAQATKRTLTLVIPYGVGAGVVWFLLLFMGENHKPVFWVGGALLAGAALMLVTMIFVMRKEVQFSLDYKRWLGALFVALAMFIWGYGKAPYNLVNLIYSGTVAVVIGSSVAFLLLWRNPALDGLIHVKLMDKKEQ